MIYFVWSVSEKKKKKFHRWKNKKKKKLSKHEVRPTNFWKLGVYIFCFSYALLQWERTAAQYLKTCQFAYLPIPDAWDGHPILCERPFPTSAMCGLFICIFVWCFYISGPLTSTSVCSYRIGPPCLFSSTRGKESIPDQFWNVELLQPLNHQVLVFREAFWIFLNSGQKKLYYSHYNSSSASGEFSFSF